MKKVVVIIFFAMLGLAPVLKAQAIIVQRPVAAVVIRPACPGPGYVWVNPYRQWSRRMNTYVWVNGYWGRPRGGWHRRGRFVYRF